MHFIFVLNQGSKLNLCISLLTPSPSKLQTIIVYLITLKKNRYFPFHKIKNAISFVIFAFLCSHDRFVETRAKAQSLP